MTSSMVSTGLANVAVHFACEQQILKSQLDVEKATESARSCFSMTPLTMTFPFSANNGLADGVKRTDSDSHFKDVKFLDDLLDHAKEAAVSLDHYTDSAA